MKIFTTAFVLFMLFLAPALLSLGIREIPLKSQGALVNRHKIYGGIEARDEFTPQNNNLSAVGITIRNFNLMNKKNISLSVILDGEVVRETTISGANIPDGALVKFKFEPIPDSKNKNYIFSFASPTSSSEEAFEVYFGEDNKTLALADYYQSSNKLELVGIIYKSFLGRFFSDKLFAWFYLSVILAPLVYIRVNSI